MKICSLVKGGGEGASGEMGGGVYRTSHKRPSAEVCFFVASSLRTRDWRVDELPGEASWRSRTFCGGGGEVGQQGMHQRDHGLARKGRSWLVGKAWKRTFMFPIMSFLTGVNAIDPRTSVPREEGSV